MPYPHPNFPYSSTVEATYDLDERWRDDYPLIIDYNHALNAWFEHIHFSFYNIFH